MTTEAQITGVPTADVPTADAGPLYRAACDIEEADRLDPLVLKIRSALPAALGRGRVRDLLGGRWLGHAAHPMLSDFPLGMWMSASLLDLLPGRYDDASRRLIAAGLVGALPTAAAGWSDWLQADQREQRVGVVHAATNVTALTLYTGSYAARRAGRRRLGVALGIAGGLTATVGGFFGGHLSTARDTALRSSATGTAGETAPA